MVLDWKPARGRNTQNRAIRGPVCDSGLYTARSGGPVTQESESRGASFCLEPLVQCLTILQLHSQQPMSPVLSVPVTQESESRSVSGGKTAAFYGPLLVMQHLLKNLEDSIAWPPESLINLQTTIHSNIGPWKADERPVWYTWSVTEYTYLSAAVYREAQYYLHSMLLRWSQRLQSVFPGDSGIVATIVFGMGMDVHNINAVVNLGLPSSLDALLQQLG
ncbi:hypothetical protein BDN71DRAFT_1435140 [Pleurotus eryngii]|uniref:Uncharacterized protein n=1 Tax=Pleurotus eryngii TaxID=5323 RepID=A0A9P5ZK71_PLEER|nr:hypothetical protein BDN71DRAFT_1435140 [Pleurotus eryngii]